MPSVFARDLVLCGALPCSSPGRLPWLVRSGSFPEASVFRVSRVRTAVIAAAWCAHGSDLGRPLPTSLVAGMTFLMGHFRLPRAQTTIY